MEFITLNNGVKMPLEGFGVFQVPDSAQCEQAVLDAIASGYRLIDTAAAYMNEKAVGKAIKKSGVPREELFITTKLWVQDAGYDSTLKAFDRSLKKLGLSYLDLYLIHQPFGDYYGAWRAMERLYEEGAVRAIGVSNFSPDRLVDLCLNQCIRPMVNQIELHPFYQQPEALQVMESYGVVPQAWGPLSEAQKDIFQHRTLMRIAQKRERAPRRSSCGGTTSGEFPPSPKRCIRSGCVKTWTSSTLPSPKKRWKRLPRWISGTARSSTTAASAQPDS